MGLSELLTNKWIVPKDVRPSFKGCNVIVTGANVGLGYETALKFVQLGANRVVLAVRTLSKGEEAKRQVESKTGRTGVAEVWQLDMLNYDSIKAFADKATKDFDHLDIACLNAGIAGLSYQESDYGYERTMQVNVLSTTLLALLLMPKLKASRTATYTPVLEMVGSSNAGLVSKLHSDRTPFASYNTPTGFGKVGVQYNVSKLFVLYVQAGLVDLAKNKESGNPDVFIPVVCPGATNSELGREVKAWLVLRVLLWLFEVLIQRTTEEGARTYISGIDQGEKTHGEFWKDDKIRAPAPLMAGEKGKQLRATVWEEVVDALAKDVPEVRQLVGT
ncbi:hypothetical protein LTR37_013996 [Vermiconidia calcicola]|uniref:Uncharacterized protein n=1 Tax=Vermiconidia calcicola TaxID=1690605 RepID=A0ACC3MVK0_9PEZI|nr:hypothetical protein LTR37_013996 [Vermiconidia calcicola]